ncbi:MAG: hypothetical protein KBD76_07905 [Bacteriovorax sp.]|nr:hypothetical protein [Bacteriovorax sp.]
MTISNFVRQLILAKNIHINQVTNTPICIISSRADRLVHHSCSERIAKLLNGRLIQHELAGHDLPLDEPLWLCERLIELIP